MISITTQGNSIILHGVMQHAITHKSFILKRPGKFQPGGKIHHPL